MTKIVEWNEEGKESVVLPVFKSFLLSSHRWIKPAVEARDWGFVSEHPAYSGLWYAWDEGDYNNGCFFSTKQLWKKGDV